MTLTELNENFALPGVLAFDEHNGLTRAQVTLPSGAATVYLYGAHVTHWQPKGQAPVIWLSSLAEFGEGKAIRGGVPVCFPWFATDTEKHDGGKPGPSHGFARTQNWDFAFAALAGEALHLTFTLAPNEISRRFGYDHFRVAYEVVVADTLTLKLTVANTGTEPLKFEEALHTYFNVGELHSARLTGLESAPFIDKTDGMKAKTGPAEALEFPVWTDRMYPHTTATTVIHDGHDARTITVAKQHSATTVVWNPHPEGSAGAKDLAPNSWESFLAVETANAGADAITLQPGEAHTMQAVYSVAAIGR